MKKTSSTKTRKRNGNTLFRRIAIPLFAVMILLPVAFYASTVFGGVVTMLDQNAEGVLQERVNNKETDLGTLFANNWSDFSSTAAAIDADYNVITQNGTQPLYDSPAAQKELLETTFDDMTGMLRSNAVTGTFLILNDSATFSEPEDGAVDTLYGVCVRDYDPTSAYTDKEDLLVSRCPSSMVSTAGCSIDSWWEANYVFDGTIESDYFYRPLEQAYLNPGVNNDNFAYFCAPHTFGQSDRDVVSYSIPLIDKNGYPYGVLGVELTVDYLKTLIPALTLYGVNDGCFVLAQYAEDSNDYSIVAGNGTLYAQTLESSASFTAETDENGILNYTSPDNNVMLCGYAADIPIYNRNTPFEDQHFALVGFVKHDSLYSVSSTVKTRILLVSIVVLLLGVTIAFFICRGVTKPINDLSMRVRSTRDDEMPELGRINIAEIDDLVESIETLSTKINRNTVRTEFFSRMSHDMRTPMNAVIGFSSPELTEDASLEQLHDYLNKIHSSGTYLLGLINEVLDMTKIEAERMTIHRSPVNGTCVWLSVVDMITRVAEEGNVSFLPTIDTTDCWFLADRLHLEQVLMNLLSNAVKFTPEHGSVSYDVSCEGMDESTVRYRIIVSDTGCGMSEEFLNTMYEPFAQEHSDDSIESGTGLGLAITKQIIELMDGTIECTSTKDEGTRFTIHLSFERTNIRRDDAIDDTALLSADNLVDKQVLLCDDSPLNSEIAESLLERRGMIVTTARDGREGVEAFEKSSEGFFDLILMDIRMPHMNGLEATRAIRALSRADAATIPIVAMTANAFTEDIEQSKAAGMNRHLSKPVDPDILYTTLEALLDVH